MKLAPCSNCQQKMRWITTIDAIIVLQCESCSSVEKRPKPDDWREPGQNFNAKQARANDTSTVHDVTAKTEALELLQALENTNPKDINEEFIKITAARLVLSTLIANCASKRPTVRQRAAETLTRVMWQQATTRVDLTSAGKELQALTAEELVDRAKGVVGKLAALANDGIPDSES